MDFLDLAKKRFSVRKYQQKEVEKEKLEKILEASQVAPTAANKQPQRLLVINNTEGLEKIKKAANIFDAPLAIIVCADKTEAWVRKFDQKNTIDIDASIITDHMMLQATELDLGSLWICFFEPTILKKEFNIPENLEPVNILAIGYLDGKIQSSTRHNLVRKPISETVVYNSF